MWPAATGKGKALCRCSFFAVCGAVVGCGCGVCDTVIFGGKLRRSSIFLGGEIIYFGGNFSLLASSLEGRQTASTHEEEAQQTHHASCTGRMEDPAAAAGVDATLTKKPKNLGCSNEWVLVVIVVMF